MIPISSKVIGSEQLIAKLQSIKATEARKAIRKGSRAAAKIVQAEAIRQAPKITGTIAKNIKVRSLARSRRFVGCTVKEISPHAGFTEWGTRKNKGKGPRAFGKAFDHVKDQATSTFLGVMADEIEKALKQ